MDAVRETSTLIAADKVQGTDVFSNGGDRLGSVHDLMIDKQTGQVAYAILSFGGFLGVGSSYHPLPWVWRWPLLEHSRPALTLFRVVRH